MSKFRPRLARYNNCCEQVMPAPVIPICAISCQLPRPICEVNYTPLYCNQLPMTYQGSQTSSSCAPCQQQNQHVQNNQENHILQNTQQVLDTNCNTCNLNEEVVEESHQGSYSISIDNYIQGKSYTTGTILTNMTGIIPSGFLLCDGLDVSRNEYNDLFNLIGIMFGDGDGLTTFNIPNLGDSSVNEATYIIKT
jgi:hypothetical protein